MNASQLLKDRSKGLFRELQFQEFVTFQMTKLCFNLKCCRKQMIFPMKLK